MNSIVLSVVLPSYEEEENLNNLIPDIQEVLKSMKVSNEIIVIDTEKKIDKTQEVCNKYKCKYVSRVGGNSYGNAIRTGIDRSKGSFLLFMDADGSHDPKFIPDLYRHIDNYDVVVASRYIDKGDTENNFISTLMSKTLNVTYSLILGIPCKDISNSFKIYHRNQLCDIELTCNNFDIVEEIMFKLNRQVPDFKIKEIPFVFKRRALGKTKRNLFLFILTYAYTIIKLRLK